MARLIFPDEGSRLVYQVAGRTFAAAPGNTASVYSDAACTIPANIRTPDDEAIPSGTLVVDQNSLLPDWLGPEGDVDTLYVKVSDGPGTVVYARSDARIDAIEAAASTAVPGTEKGAANGVATLDDAGTLAVSQVPATVARRGDLYFSVKDYGAVGNGTVDDSAAFEAAMDAADAAGGGSPIFLPPGRYNVGTGISMSGRRCGIKGVGAGYSFGLSSGSVIYAKTQDGPVLDFTGWIAPSNFRGRISFENFVVEGSGVDNTANHGVYIAGAHGGMAWRNIVIHRTGGIALNMGPIYLSTFDNITLVQPVNCTTNDTPYMYIEAANANTFTSVGFMAPLSAESCPASGALRFVDDGTFAGGTNSFRATWFENLHAPTNGTLFHMAGVGNTISDIILQDNGKEAGATGTSILRLAPPAVGDIGGNLVTGLIPAGSSGTLTDYGIDILQSRNAVMGVKNWPGTNIRLNSGVTDTVITLTGQVSGATTAAVVDNSGNTTNQYSDSSLGTFRYRNNTEVDTVANGILRIKNSAAPTNAQLSLGNAGAGLSVVSGSFFLFPKGTNQNVRIHDWNNVELCRFDAAGSLVPAIRAAAGVVIQTGRSVTASRPDAVKAGAGAMFFDTTLVKPIWSDGTNWKDATGATV